MEDGKQSELDLSAYSQALPSSPEPPVLELDRLRSMMREAGIEEMVDRLIDLFLEDAPERMRALEEASAELVASDLRLTAHAFKSAALGIHAPALATVLQRVESAAVEGRVGEAALLLPLVREQHRAVADLLISAVEQRGSRVGAMDDPLEAQLRL